MKKLLLLTLLVCPLVGLADNQFLEDPTIEERFPLEPPYITLEGIAILGNEVDVWDQYPDGDRFTYGDDLNELLVWLAGLSIEIAAIEADDPEWGAYLRSELVAATQLAEDYDTAIYGFAGAVADNDRAGRRVDSAYEAFEAGAFAHASQLANEAYEYLDLRVYDEALGRGWYDDAMNIAYDLSMEVYGY